MKNWKAEDTLVAKGSKAKVIASDLSDGQNWVTVEYNGQEYQGYQTEFEAKGWRKLDSAMGLGVGCGCFTLFGLILVPWAIVSSLSVSDSPQPVERSDSSQPVERVVQPSPQHSPLPNIQVPPEEFVQDKLLMAQRLAKLDGVSSSKPYVEKLTQLGKSCSEFEKDSNRSVEAFAPDVGRLTALIWTKASERGIKISNLELLQVLERALQTNPQVNCDTTLLLEMRRLYPQQWEL